MDLLAHGMSEPAQDKHKARHAVLVNKHSSLVVRIARHLSAKMPSSVQVDDLIQAGMVGLLEAAGKYDESKGASFETFAGIRIRGAMLDEIRRGDWGPRSVYRNNRKVNEATRKVEARLGRDARDDEVAAEMDIELKEYFNILKDMRGCRLFSFEDMFESEESRLPNTKSMNSPDLQLVDEKFKMDLAMAINRLPERERMVLILYYNRELNLKEIGCMLGVSESRVSQIHSQAAGKLRISLKSWL